MVKKPKRSYAGRGDDLGVIKLCPTSVYTIGQVCRLFGMSKQSVQREVRLHGLRVSVRLGRAWFLGAWLLEWVERGERQRTKSSRREGGIDDNCGG
jgi:hypothetical protein